MMTRPLWSLLVAGALVLFSSCRIGPPPLQPILPDASDDSDAGDLTWDIRDLSRDIDASPDRSQDIDDTGIDTDDTTNDIAVDLPDPQAQRYEECQDGVLDCEPPLECYGVCQLPCGAGCPAGDSCITAWGLCGRYVSVGQRCSFDEGLFCRNTDYCDVRTSRCASSSSGSCPYVFLWTGSGYRYVTDLSGSVLGYGIPFFRPQYYAANVYALGDFEPHEGVYRMKLREVIHESSFFDQATLVLVDVPEGYGVYNTSSFTSQLERETTREYRSVHGPRPPRSAQTADGRDVLAQVSLADGVPLPVQEDGLSRVVVDFGPLEHPEEARLVITAWGYYADYTTLQDPPFSAGITIETPGPDGQWETRLVAGKAQGDAKTWIIDLEGILSAEDSRMRITLAHLRTVLDVLDAVLLDDSPQVEMTIHRMLPQQAELGFGGSTQVQFSTLEHRIFAEDLELPALPSALLEGDYTRYGDVIPLLKTADDRFVVMAHGDQLLLEFGVPPLAPGMERHAFLEADVFYTLKYHPLGLLTESAAPLPYHGMVSYPYDPESWPYRDDPSYAGYLERWNTRAIRIEPVGFAECLGVVAGVEGF